MPETPKQPKFDTREAKRFASLMAGCDTGNPSETEASSKFRLVRRIVAARNVRLVDALELPEIRQALDAQMQPVRIPVPDLAPLQAENLDLRAKLSKVVPEVTRLADALKQQRELTARLNARLQRQPQRNRSVTGSWRSGVLGLALAVECVLGVIGLIDSRGTSHWPAQGSLRVHATGSVGQRTRGRMRTEGPKGAAKKPAKRTQKRTYARPKTKPPVREASF